MSAATYYVVFADAAGNTTSESFATHDEGRKFHLWVKYHEDAVRSLFYGRDEHGCVTEYARCNDIPAWRDEMDQADAADYRASKRLCF